MFEVPGEPVGKGRPRFARRENHVATYTPEKTASYENLVKMTAFNAMGGGMPVDYAVSVRMALWVSIPASWSAKKKRMALEGQIFPTSKPDMDNVIKGIFDACNRIVWLDDKQVIDLDVSKRYSNSPMAAIMVRKA